MAEKEINTIRQAEAEAVAEYPQIARRLARDAKRGGTKATELYLKHVVGPIKERAAENERGANWQPLPVAIRAAIEILPIGPPMERSVLTATEIATLDPRTQHEYAQRCILPAPEMPVLDLQESTPIPSPEEKICVRCGCVYNPVRPLWQKYCAPCGTIMKHEKARNRQARYVERHAKAETPNPLNN